MTLTTRLTILIAAFGLGAFTMSCKDKEDDKMTGLRPKAGARAVTPGATPGPPVNTPNLPTTPTTDNGFGTASPGDDDDDDDDVAPPLSAQDASKHPYAQKLTASMRDAWSPPAGATGSATGCIRLSPDGQVAGRMVQKGGHTDLEASVEAALNAYQGVGQPIPKALAPRLTGWVCAKFTPPK